MIFAAVITIANRFLLLTLVVCLLASTAVAQKPGKTKAKAVAQNGVSLETKPAEKKASKKKEAAEDSVSESEKSRREDWAYALVRKHHPELASLLRSLKRLKPRQYESAIRELSRVSEKLHQIEQRQPERYELELAVWKSKSRIQLLTAQLQMSPDDEELRDRLRQVISQQIVSQRQLLEFEKDRVSQRIEFLNAQLERMDGDVATMVEQRLRAIDPAVKRAPRSRNATSASQNTPKE
ncbi:hypothetical protein M4951_03825 [Blastopirellula sp. J2-11]|uniref:hypothetical protein n=1 Tax=Blastopirellula sp. J2-11 TaxID=2943192 RepID=UPI0021C7FF06|nr:hypothetical protein [Blastopirellula sp. J2-11]UUO07444.1 hypothetical protein M4951_03825 [Blastopirellula sp. J2-11]